MFFLKYNPIYTCLTIVFCFRKNILMGIIAPPSKSKPDKDVKVDKSFLTNSLVAEARKMVTLEDGRVVTKAQAMAERLSDIAIFAESNTDAIAAQKLIYERIVGKAVPVKADETKPMPTVSFVLNDISLDKVNAIANQSEIANDNENDELGILIETDTGEEFII